MAAFSQLSRNKRARDEYLNSGLASPEAKRTNSRTFGRHSDLMVFLEKIDNMDNNHSNLENTHTAMNEAEDGIRPMGVIKSLKDEIGLKAQTDNNIESTDEKGSTEQMVSNEQGELTEAIGDFKYCGDASGELGFFVDQFSTDELRIIMNHFGADYILDIIYSDAVHAYVDTAEVFYGSLWEDDIWQLNGHRPVIQNDFTSPRQEEFGVSGAEFHDIWK